MYSLCYSGNYCVSGNAVAYYFDKDWSCIHPLKTMTCKHLGSIVGGSFMTGFFGLGDFIFDLLKGVPCCTSFLTTCCVPCLKLFELVRSDAMAYINITGIPFCNSSRTCEYLCNNSAIFEGSQNTSRVYRLASHIFLIGLNCILALYVKGNIAPTALFVVFVLTFFIVTFCISIHADAAEALIICYLTDEEWNKREGIKTNPIYDNHDKSSLHGMNMKQS